MPTVPPGPPPNDPLPAGVEPLPVIDSAALLQGRAEVVIRHAGREYRLRHTRLGKLILTA
jgi:hemin uptake protein HemP